MARLTRKNIKVFAGSASNNGVFGSLQANNPVQTNDVEQIQGLTAWENGWNDATMTSDKLPPLEEFQGIQYVLSYEQAYLMQEGLPEWAATVTYYKGSLTKEVTANGFRIYNSLTDNNTGNLLTDTANWKKVMDSEDLYATQSDMTQAQTDISQLQTDVSEISYVGDIKASVRSANHGNWFLCNGQAISRTTYSDLFDLIGTTYGSGDGSTTFNIPDFSNVVLPTATTVGVRGTGKTLGFTNGTDVAGLIGDTSSYNHHIFRKTAIDKNVSTSLSGTSEGPIDGLIGVATDAAKSGLTGDITSTTTMNYFIRVK